MYYYVYALSYFIILKSVLCSEISLFIPKQIAELFLFVRKVCRYRIVFASNDKKNLDFQVFVHCWCEGFCHAALHCSPMCVVSSTTRPRRITKYDVSPRGVCLEAGGARGCRRRRMLIPSLWRALLRPAYHKPQVGACAQYIHISFFFPVLVCLNA